MAEFLFDENNAGPGFTVTEGGRVATATSANSARILTNIGRLASDGGKFYYEMEVIDRLRLSPGFSARDDEGASYSSAPGEGDAVSVGYNRSNLNIYYNSIARQGGIAQPINGDYVQIAFDFDAGTIQFYKNGVINGSSYDLISDFPGYTAITWYPLMGEWQDDNASVRLSQDPVYPILDHTYWSADEEEPRDDRVLSSFALANVQARSAIISVNGQRR